MAVSGSDEQHPMCLFRLREIYLCYCSPLESERVREMESRAGVGECEILQGLNVRGVRIYFEIFEFARASDRQAKRKTYLA